MSCIDATLKASEICGAMAAVTGLIPDSGKLVATRYALYSGLLFLVTGAVVSAPLIQGRLHRFHLD